MRTIENICNDLNIEYKKDLYLDNDLCHYEGIIKNNTLLVKRKALDTNLNKNSYELYVVYDNLYIKCLFDTEDSLNLMYTYLNKNNYSKILELSNINEILEFHVELL